MRVDRAVVEPGLVAERVDDGNVALCRYQDQVVDADGAGYLEQRREAGDEDVVSARAVEDEDEDDERRVEERDDGVDEVGRQHARKDEVGMRCQQQQQQQQQQSVRLEHVAQTQSVRFVLLQPVARRRKNSQQIYGVSDVRRAQDRAKASNRSATFRPDRDAVRIRSDKQIRNQSKTMESERLMRRG